MLAGSFLVIALLLGGIGSLFASSYPDALDSLTGSAYMHESGNSTVAAASRIQEQTAPMPDYQWKNFSEWAGTSASGVIGTFITLLLVWAIGRFLHAKSKQNNIGVAK